jgi:hypothetical protein
MKLNLQGIEVKAARVLVGMKGHRPSAFNACVGAQLKKKTYAKPPAGMGGRNNKAVRSAFVSAVNSCKGK